MTLPDLRIKEGVILRSAHLRPHMTDIIVAALRYAPEMKGNEVWITSAKRRPAEKTKSKHPMCGAFDFRCKNILAADRAALVNRANEWAADIKKSLGSDYDVLAHGDGDNFHVHVEYDPK